MISGSSSLNGVTLDANLTVGGAPLYVQNGLTLNGTLTLVETDFYSNVYFQETQTLSGTGQVVFGGSDFGASDSLSARGNGGSDPATLTIGPGITIHGVPGASVRASITGDQIVNEGTIDADVAGLTISLSATTVTNQGTLSEASGGLLNITGNVTNTGQITPGGPGSPGVISINGSFTQTSTGVLSIDLGGTTPGTQFDQLNITGPATLAGTLNLDLVNGFTPAIGDMFQFMTFGSESGTFTTVNGTDLGGGHKFVAQYNSGNLTLGVS